MAARVEHNGRAEGKVWHVVDDKYTMPMAAFYDEPRAVEYAAKVNNLGGRDRNAAADC